MIIRSRSSRKCPLAGALASIALALSPVWASDGWPQFRALASGHTDASDLPLTWSEADHIKWKTPLPGDTFQVLAENPLADGCLASPAVAGKALVLRTKTGLYRIEN